jgi:hypothetical protein
MNKLHDPHINYKKHPEAYRIGRGEQGVLTVKPYKSEILPFWKFKTADDAKESSTKIYDLFFEYLDQDDFVGADMARKLLRMGMTRAKRYARHSSGKKYEESGEEKEEDFDQEKQQSSDIFKEKWQQAKSNKKYLQMKDRHRKKYY